MIEPEPELLGSRHPEIKRLRRLVRQAKARSQERVFVVDGPTLVGEALASSQDVLQVFVGVDDGHPATELDPLAVWSGKSAAERPCPVVYRVDVNILRSVLDPVTPQPIAAVVATPAWSEDALGVDRPVMIAVELSDPGNLGTVIRTAEAAGFAGVVVTENSVDITNPKVVRASAGSILRLPVLSRRPLSDAVRSLRAAGHRVVAAVVDAGAEVYDGVDLVSAAIMIGNEPRGLSPEQAAMADHTITIPMSGPSESLNVGAAAAVLAFEAARQRRRGRRERLEQSP